MNQEIINRIPVIAFQKGIQHCVICPGSRSAPLTLAFARFDKIKKHVVIDERSAAFIALGIAQQTKKPVVIITTSGTAALNIFPAIAEAYFQFVPLFVITADRPEELIGKWDGQTIFQDNVYGKHVHAFSKLEENTTAEIADDLLNRIINTAIKNKGPVHLNVPLSEPLYPKSITFNYPDDVKITEMIPQKNNFVFTDELKNRWTSAKKKLLVAGADFFNETGQLKALANRSDVVVLSDFASNMISDPISFYDIALSMADSNLKKELAPDLLITAGGPIISKSLKNFLKEYKAKDHWHISNHNTIPDTFGTLKEIIAVNTDFNSLDHISDDEYTGNWKKLTQSGFEMFSELLEKERNSEPHAVKIIMENLPPCILHVANSMPARYVNYFGINNPAKIQVFSNRGTSGIDGCVSTALGASIVSDKAVVLLTGDLAFFYDRNGLWNDLESSLKIIILNNNGGGIFKLIDGPSCQPELEEYFVTPHHLNAKNTASDHGLEYYFCNEASGLAGILNEFLSSDSRGILEIFTDNKETIELHNALRQIKIS